MPLSTVAASTLPAMPTVPSPLLLFLFPLSPLLPRFVTSFPPTLLSLLFSLLFLLLFLGWWIVILAGQIVNFWNGRWRRCSRRFLLEWQDLNFSLWYAAILGGRRRKRLSFLRDLCHGRRRWVRR